MKQKYLYSGKPAEAQSAAGIKGTIIRAFDGTLMFRVYYNNERFTDYEIKHDDLNVTIDKDALAVFNKVGDQHILDYSPQVLGAGEDRGLKLRAPLAPLQRRASAKM